MPLRDVLLTETLQAFSIMLAYQLAEIFHIFMYVGIFQSGDAIDLGYSHPSMAVNSASSQTVVFALTVSVHRQLRTSSHGRFTLYISSRAPSLAIPS